ncbi:FUSC family protein [Psychromonas ossibalaenae]|uniref:FUSC family protein n=1 Tax=Psychromonas ossibalaenae TaxID=444922 RepID=UPI0003624028|nr:FUSC family protein [Psychromonas ossibalaenae]
MLLSDRFVIRHQRMLHALRVVIACAIALVVIRVFEFPHSSWALITIIVVMGPVSYLGSVLTKANQRLSGTIIGALLGLAVYLLPGAYIVLHDLILLLILAVAMYAVVGKYSYAAVLVALTLFLVAGPGGADNIVVAEWRAINVVWATLLTILCSRLFFPSRALVHFQLLVTEFLLLSSDYYLLHNKGLNSDNGAADYNLKLLSTNLNKQRSLMAHIYKEWKGDEQDITDIIFLERRILSVLETLINRQWRSQDAFQKIKTNSDLMHGASDLFEHMNQISLQVDMGDVQQILADDISLFTITSETVSAVDSCHQSNINFFGYLWLNHELARHVCAVSFSLSKVFNRQHFRKNKQE